MAQKQAVIAQQSVKLKESDTTVIVTEIQPLNADDYIDLPEAALDVKVLTETLGASQGITLSDVSPGTRVTFAAASDKVAIVVSRHRGSLQRP